MEFKRELIGLVYLICLTSLTLSDQSYTIDIENVGLSPDNDPAWFTSFTLRCAKKDKNTFAVDGGFDLLKNLGDEIMATLAVYKKDKFSGNYLPTPIYTKSSTACKMYNELKMVDDLIAASNLPQKGQCPLSKGNYNVRDFTISPDDFPSYVPAGEYKIVFTAMKEQQFIAAIDLFVNVVTVK